MSRFKTFIGCTLLLYATAALLYFLVIRPTYFHWGASKTEQQMKLPGDEFIPQNTVVSTRAINIQASGEDVFPWIAQTGQNRGGFNSYAWLENLFGAKMVNANHIHAEWQNVQPGDTVYYGKNQDYGIISLVQRNHVYSINGWTFYLHPVDGNQTRLLVRYASMEIKQSIPVTVFYYALFEQLHFIMETGMMMGIKHRAETYNRHETNARQSIQ